MDEFVNETDVKGLVKKASIEKEVKLFKNALDFSKVKLREIMVPQTEIEMLELNSTNSELRQKIVEPVIPEYFFIVKMLTILLVTYIHLSFFKIPIHKTIYSKCFNCSRNHAC